MFRNKALVKLKSPEQLDEPLKVMPRQMGLAFKTLGGILLFALLWGTFGRLPTVGRGQGILITPNSVIPLQVQAEGQVARWLVEKGDFVEAEQVIGLLEQPDLLRQLEQARAKRLETEIKQTALSALREQFWTLEETALARRDRLLDQRIEELSAYLVRARQFIEAVNTNDRTYLAAQRQALEANKQAKSQLTVAFQERVASYERLSNERLTPTDALLEQQRRYEDSLLELRNLELQLQEMELKQVQLAESLLDAQMTMTNRENELTQFNLQRREFENRLAQLQKERSETRFQVQNELNELDRQIERLGEQLGRHRQIVTPFSGQILELTVNEGAVVTAGDRLAQIDTRRPTDPLVALAYFQDKLGKQLHPDMAVRVSPSTVPQKRYGSIRGTIISVSPFPITAEGAMNYVGNREVASQLTGNRHQIEVFIALERALTPSGYLWTSMIGPNTVLTAGTTADVWVTSERRSPLSYVPPIVRRWVGL